MIIARCTHCPCEVHSAYHDPAPDPPPDMPCLWCHVGTLSAVSPGAAPALPRVSTQAGTYWGPVGDLPATTRPQGEISEGEG